MDSDNPIEEAVGEIESFIEEFADDLGGEFAGRVPVDLRDDGDAYVVTVDLPGYDRSELTVELAEGRLRVGAQRETGADEDRSGPEGRYVRRERRRSSVSRTIPLPEPVEETATEATYSQGVLTVTLPKADPDTDATTIEVE